MKIMITAGGTGGHIFPALVLFDEFKKLKNEVKFVCRKKDYENFFERLNKINKNLIFIDYMGLKRKFSLNFFVFVFAFIKSFFKIFKIMKNEKPDIIIGFGGYLSFLPAFVGRILRIKIVLIEQNSIPGLSNKLIYKFADKVILNYEYTKKWFKKGEVIGNPVNPKIGKIKKSDAKKMFKFYNNKKTILILGGSQGAESINKVIANNLDKLKKYNIIWSCGKKNYNKYNTIAKKYKNVILKPFITKIEYALAASDIAVCRAGASTISEIKASRLPSIFIPYPYATENHQYYNAVELVEKSNGLLIKDKDLTFDNLIEKIECIFKNYRKFKESFDKTLNVNKSLVDEILKIA